MFIGGGRKAKMGRADEREKPQRGPGADRAPEKGFRGHPQMSKLPTS